MKSKRILVVVAFAITAILLVISTATFMYFKGIEFRGGAIYYRVDSFRYAHPTEGRSCDENTPECGYCYENGKLGFIENRKCYMPL